MRPTRCLKQTILRIKDPWVGNSSGWSPSIQSIFLPQLKASSKSSIPRTIFSQKLNGKTLEEMSKISLNGLNEEKLEPSKDASDNPHIQIWKKIFAEKREMKMRNMKVPST